MNDVLRTKEDLSWLEKVHGIRGATKYKCAVLAGNADSPRQIELFARDHYLCEPAIWLPDAQTGEYKLVESGEPLKAPKAEAPDGP